MRTLSVLFLVFLLAGLSGCSDDDDTTSTGGGGACKVESGGVTTCTQYGDDYPAASIDAAKNACTTGTWLEAGCPATNSNGNCKMVNAGYTVTYYYYGLTGATGAAIKQGCTGTWTDGETPITEPSTEDPAGDDESDDPSTTDPSEDPATTDPSDDPATTDPSDDPATTDPSEDPATTDPTEDSVPVDFAGTLIAFGSNPATPVPGMTVTVLSNTTGETVPDFTATTSAADGKVTFADVPSGKIGFKVAGVVGADSVRLFRDTYQFNIDASATSEVLWIVPEAVYSQAPMGAGLQVQAGKSVAAGGVYWVNGQVEEPVACATVEIVDGGAGQIRYFGDNNLPAPFEGFTGMTDGATLYKGINRVNGYYLIANMEPGEITVRALVGTTEIGRTTFFNFADSINIGNIYASGDANPSTTTTCTEAYSATF